MCLYIITFYNILNPVLPLLGLFYRDSNMWHFQKSLLSLHYKTTVLAIVYVCVVWSKQCVVQQRIINHNGLLTFQFKILKPQTLQVKDARVRLLLFFWDKILSPVLTKPQEKLLLEKKMQLSLKLSLLFFIYANSVMICTALTTDNRRYANDS